MREAYFLEIVEDGQRLPVGPWRGFDTLAEAISGAKSACDDALPANHVLVLKGVGCASVGGDGEPSYRAVGSETDRRTTACVRALEGLPTESLELLAPGDLATFHAGIAHDPQREPIIRGAIGIVAELVSALRDLDALLDLGEPVEPGELGIVEPRGINAAFAAARAALAKAGA